MKKRNIRLAASLLLAALAAAPALAADYGDTLLAIKQGLLFGDKKKVLELYKRAVSMNPAGAEAHRSYGEFLLSEKKYDEAVKELGLAQQAPRRVGEKEIADHAICNAMQCMKYSEETDARYRDYTAKKLEEAKKKGK